MVLWLINHTDDFTILLLSVCLSMALETSVGLRPLLRFLNPVHTGRVIAEAVSRWLPTAAAKWDLWWTKWRQGRFSPSTARVS
jgi:hypothetical protein